MLQKWLKADLHEVRGLRHLQSLQNSIFMSPPLPYTTYPTNFTTSRTNDRSLISLAQFGYINHYITSTSVTQTHILFLFSNCNQILFLVLQFSIQTGYKKTGKKYIRFYSCSTCCIIASACTYMFLHNYVLHLNIANVNDLPYSSHFCSYSTSRL